MNWRNKVEHWRRNIDGMKNYNDIMDNSTMAEFTDKIDRSRLNLEEHTDIEQLSPTQKACLEKIHKFIATTTELFKTNFWSIINDYRAGGGELSPRIADFLKRQAFDLPKFTVADPNHAKELSASRGIEPLPDSHSGDFLLIFQFPKPLAKLWWKGGAEFGDDKAVKINKAAIEWGNFYRKLLPTIWKSRDRWHNNKQLSLQRMNDYFQHDEENYYYVWAVNNTD